jgi:hypothetical protein
MLKVTACYVAYARAIAEDRESPFAGLPGI